MNLAWLFLSGAVGIGFGYATLGVLSIIGTNKLGFALWWLEPLIAVAVGLICFWLCTKVATRQTNSPILSRGERAIWRLAYRRGWELSLEEILQNTMLEQSAALAALQKLEATGQAVQLEPNRWKLKQ